MRPLLTMWVSCVRAVRVNSSIVFSYSCVCSVYYFLESVPFFLLQVLVSTTTILYLCRHVVLIQMRSSVCLIPNAPTIPNRCQLRWTRLFGHICKFVCVLCCAVLCCAVLCCVVLCCVLCCAVLCCVH